MLQESHCNGESEKNSHIVHDSVEREANSDGTQANVVATGSV